MSREVITTLLGRELRGRVYDPPAGEVIQVQVERLDPGTEQWELNVSQAGQQVRAWRCSGERFDFQLINAVQFQISVASKSGESLSVSVQTRVFGGFDSPSSLQDLGEPPPEPVQDPGSPEQLPAAEFEELVAEVEGLT